MPDALTAHPPAGPASQPVLPPEIASAVAQVMAKAAAPPRNALGAHGGCSPVGTDTVLAKVGPLCAEAGLIVIQDEETIELLDRGGRTWLQIVYTFHLAHRSGALWERALRRTIVLRMEGPQAFGKAQSFALGQFLGALFQIAADGWEDAGLEPCDSMSAQEHSARPLTASDAAATDVTGVADRLAMISDASGHPLIGAWTRAAVAELAALTTVEARRHWLARHAQELEQVQDVSLEHAAEIELMATTGELPPLPNAPHNRTAIF